MLFTSSAGFSRIFLSSSNSTDIGTENLPRMSAMKIFDLFKSGVKLSKFIWTTEGCNFLFPLSVLILIYLSQRQGTLVIPVQHSSLPVLTVNAVPVAGFVDQPLLHHSVHQPLPLLMVPPLLLQ